MKKITVDVAVAGAGVAGVTSAVSVGEKGYSVALFEAKNGFGDAVRDFEAEAGAVTDGAPVLGGVNGIFAVETEFQNSRHHVTTRKDIYDYLLEHAHWSVDPRIIAEFVNRSNEVYEWLARDGLKIETVVSYYKDAPFTWLFFDSSGPRLPEILGGHFKALDNCTLYSQVEINGIVKKDGRVCGLKGVSADGEEIEVAAKAVVIATGEPGFGMGDPGDNKSARTIDLAVEIGAARGQDTLTGGAMLDNYFMPDSLGNLRQPTQLIVNRNAERFTSEEILKYLDECACNFATQKDGVAFAIFDETINRYHEEHGWFYFFYGRGPQRPENTKGVFEKCIADGADSLYLADSIEELAGKMGLNPAAFRKTVDEYNAICDSGRDPLMKDIRFLIPLTTPPFYAGRMRAKLDKLPGVLRPNHRCQVLTPELDPIPGLYVAGGAGSLLNGEIYTHRIAGSRATFALVSGRIIGESVPEYIQQNFQT